MGLWTAPAGAAQVVFNSAGSSSWSVPQGVTSVSVKAWGGGGGGGGGGTNASSTGGSGGGAGFSGATLVVTPAESLTITVGGGGGQGDFSTGGSGANSGDGGGGGGRSGVARGGTQLLIAPGGGGGGGGDNSSVTPGGNGGPGGGSSGTAGSASGSSGGGGGGTTVAGGAAGTGGNNTGTAGAALSGGAGADGRSGQGADGSKGNGGTIGGASGGNGDANANGYGGGGGGGAGRFGGGGGSGSLASNAGGGGGGGGSSLLTGSSTSTTAGSGTSAGNNGDADYAGSAGQGGTGGASSSSGTSGNPGRLVISYTSADISGTSDLADGTLVKIAVNGVRFTALTGTVSAGAWTIADVPITSNEVITVWAEDGDGDIATADEATAVTQYDGSGNITGMVLNRHVLSIGSTDNQNLSVTEIGLYGNSNDEDVLHSVLFSGTVLIVDAGNSYSDEQIRILSGNTVTVSSPEGVRTHHADLDGTLTITGTMDLTGNWDSTGGSLNAGTGTITFNGTSDQTITSDTESFYNILLNNTGSSGNDDIILSDALDINGTLTITDGNLDSGTNNVNINLAGNWLMGASGSLAAGSGVSTVILDGDNQSITGSTTFRNLTKIESTDNSSNTTLTIAASSTQTITNTLNLTGLDDDDRLVLQSNSSGVRFTFDVTGSSQTVSFLNIMDSQASSNDITALSSNNNGGNDNAEASPHWIFAVNRYWVGSAGGNTNSAANWSASENSCGVGGGASVPNTTHNVVFSNSCTNNATVNAAFNVGGILIESGYTGTITPNSSILIDIDGPLNMNDGTINLGANNTDINIAGNIIKTGGTFTAGAGTVLLDGILDLNVDGGTNLGNVLISRSPNNAVNLSSDFLSNTLTIDTGDNLITGGYEVDINGGLTLNGTLDAQSGADGNSTLNVSGDWDMTGGNFINTNSTVVFDGTSSLTSSGGAFNNIQIGSSVTGGVLSTADDLDINGSLTVNNGGATTFNISNDTVFLGGDLDLANLDTFTVTSSTVEFDGTGLQTVASNSETYNIIEVTNSSAFGVQFTESFTTADLVSTTLSAKMEFQQSTTFTVTGSLNLVGEINNEVELDSIDGSTQFSLSVTGGDQIVEFVKVANSNALNNDITARNSVNDGGNDDLTASPFWIFPLPDGFGTQVFTVAGSDTFVVPKGVTEITVKAWGGGGGGGGGGTVGTGGDGSGAAFATATLAVTPMETLDIHVGGSGGAGAFSSGGSGNASGDGAGGGGRTAVFRASTPLLISAGGGGGGGGDNSSATPGGAGGPGGGTTGVNGSASGNAGGGGGADQSSGGSGGTGGNNSGSAGAADTGGAGADGRSGQGADGSAGNGGTTNGGDGGTGDANASGYGAGGGGGSGYYGGGGGSGSQAGNAGGGGGGGGSSFVSGTATSTSDGSGTAAGNNTDTDYAGNAGQGGTGGATSGAGTAGNNGRLVISYTAATVDISGTSDLVDNTIVALAVNGNLCVGMTGVVSSGAWTINNAPILIGDRLTMWAEDGDGDIIAADESSGVTKYDGSGNISGVVLDRHVLTIGSDDNQTFTLTEIGHYDNTDDEDVMYLVTSGTVLIADADGSYTDEELNILPNNSVITVSPEGIVTHHFNLGGTLTLTGTMTVSGDWNSSSGTFNETGSTVTFNGTSDQMVDNLNQPFENFAVFNTGVPGSDNVILQYDQDINGNINISDGELDAGTNQVLMTVSGDWIASSLGTFDPGTSTVTFDGTAGTVTVALGSSTFYNVVIDDADGGADYTIELGGTFTVGGTLSLLDGTLDSHATNNYSSFIFGNWINADTFIARNGTVTFNSTANPVTITGPTTFYNLGFAGTSANDIHVSDDLLVQQDLSMSNASGSDLLADGTEIHTITVSGDINKSGAGSIEDDILLIADGTVTQTLTSGGGSIGDLQISNTSAEVILASGLVVDGTITIDAGATFDWGVYDFTTNAGSTITVDGLLQLAGSQTITLDSGPVFNPGSGAEYTATSGTHVIQDWTYQFLRINGLGGTFMMGADEILGSDFEVLAGVFQTDGYDLTINGLVDLDSTLDATAGTAGNSTIIVDGSWDMTGGTFTNADSTVLFISTNPQTITSGTSSFHHLIINDGLIAYWKMDETTGTTAYGSSGFQRDMIYVNNTTPNTGTSAMIHFDNPASLQFDGTTDYIIDSDAENYINGLSEFTVSLWVKADATGVDDGFFNGEPPNGGDNIFTLRYDLSGASGGGTNVIKCGLQVSGVNRQYESASFVQTTNWQHLALTWSSGNPIRLYIDGNLDTPTYSDAALSGTMTGATELRIGQGGKDAAAGWDGLIDDFRIYNRVLSVPEIQRLANGEQPSTALAIYTIQDALDINGTLFLNAGELDTGANEPITVSGDWNNNGGIFDPHSGNVVMDGADQNVNSSETFYDFSKQLSSGPSRTLSFGKSSTVTINNTLNLQGFSDVIPLYLRSSMAGTRFTFDVVSGIQSTYFLDVQDSQTSSNNIKSFSSINSGNTDSEEAPPHWVFGPLMGAVMIVD
ncbi:MAG: LamG-like jellyroll fold domain-containing protein [Candidatus Omnitrophota bacterium]